MEMKRTMSEDLALAVAEELQRREMLHDDWQDGMTISQNLHREKAVVEAASVIEWVLRTGRWSVEIKEPAE
jgi:hypothetical protein